MTRESIVDPQKLQDKSMSFKSAQKEGVEVEDTPYPYRDPESEERKDSNRD